MGRSSMSLDCCRRSRPRCSAALTAPSVDLQYCGRLLRRQFEHFAHQYRGAFARRQALQQRARRLMQFDARFGGHRTLDRLR